MQHLRTILRCGLTPKYSKVISGAFGPATSPSASAARCGSPLRSAPRHSQARVSSRSRYRQHGQSTARPGAECPESWESMVVSNRGCPCRSGPCRCSLSWSPARRRIRCHRSQRSARRAAVAPGRPAASGSWSGRRRTKAGEAGTSALGARRRPRGDRPVCPVFANLAPSEGRSSQGCAQIQAEAVISSRIMIARPWIMLRDDEFMIDL